jgi:2,5-furandicarboxylate decarboxylase 1
MPRDLRSHLKALGQSLLTVDSEVELAHVSTLINLAKSPVLFRRIRGYPDWSICDLFFFRREYQAAVLGVAPQEVLPWLAGKLSAPPQPASRVATGPVKELVIKGDSVDLTAVPGFQHGHRDPGRTLMTMAICRDPLTGRCNMSWTRMTPLERQRATFFIGSAPDMRAIWGRHEENSQHMPLAFVMGTHPSYEIMASYSVPNHLERFGELDLVASLLGEPVEIVPCETIPLEVPAHAELVIEGLVIPGERVDEGPGPSQALYYPEVTRQPVFKATAITMRAQPILRQVNTLIYTDHQSLIGLPHEAILYERIREMGVRVHDVQFIPWGGTLTCVVKLTPEYDAQVKDVLLFVLGSRWPNAKLAIAVDDDIDVESPEDLHWCLATRVDPARDITIINDSRGHPIDPVARPVEGAPRARVVGKWAIDATKPPLNRPTERARFDRAVPEHWGEPGLSDILKSARARAAVG